MILARPAALSLLWVLPALLALMAWNRRQTRLAVRRLVGTKLAPALTASVSPAKRALRAVALLTFVGLGALALARPRWGIELQEVRGRGVDVVIALDVSQSMDARDVAPSRMELAKLAIRELAEGLAGNRVGLIAFAGSAHLLCPLTLDSGSVALFLELATSGLVPDPGTNIGLAIAKARALLTKQAGKGKAIVLLTDGENLSGDPAKAAEEAKADGITIFTVGVGSGKAEPIPVLDEKGEVVGYKKSETGEVVQSRLDEEGLGKVAEATGGTYFRLGAGGDVGAIRAEIEALPQKEMQARREENLTERFQIPLGLALVALILEVSIGDFRGMRRRAKSARARVDSAEAGKVRPKSDGEVAGKDRSARGARAAAIRAALAGAVLLPFVLGLGPFGGAREANEAGNRQYGEGKYEDALKAYSSGAAEDTGRPELLYNMGNALERLGKHEEASRAYDQAAAAKGRADLAASVFYNRGNALLAQGKAKEAAESYVQTLARDPSHKGAKRNLEIALKQMDQKPPDSKSCPNPKKDENGKKEGKPEDQKEGKESEKKDAEGEKPSGEQKVEKGEKQSEPSESKQAQAEPEKPEEKQAEQTAAEPPKEEQAQADEKQAEKQDLTRSEAEQILKAMQAQEAQALREKAAREARRGGGRLDW